MSSAIDTLIDSNIGGGIKDQRIGGIDNDAVGGCRSLLRTNLTPVRSPIVALVDSIITRGVEDRRVVRIKCQIKDRSRQQPRLAGIPVTGTIRTLKNSMAGFRVLNGISYGEIS